MDDLDQAQLKQRANQIAVDYEGIYPAHGAFYVQAILYASERADAAFTKFGESLGPAAKPAEVVALVHEALGHTAALSRFFFPVRKGALTRARAANLRKTFAIGNASPLIDRELRNALEHFDERLDDYLLGDMFGYIFPGPMLDDAELADDPMGHIFRMVDPAREIFVLLGKKHEFGMVRSEVRRIADLARKLA